MFKKQKYNRKQEFMKNTEHFHFILPKEIKESRELLGKNNIKEVQKHGN
jgi:hypothetical protein